MEAVMMRSRERIRIGPEVRERARRLSTRLGLDAPLRLAYERLEPSAKRDRIDNEHPRLLMAFLLQEDSNCVDIGAHTGVLLREMVRCAPKGRHIAYEPLPECAEQLRRQFPGVDVRNAAVSDHAGLAVFYRFGSDTMQSGLQLRADANAAAAQAISVNLEKLDDALPDGYAPSLIKIDVEGGERQVIEGALETISRHAPIVCFEHGPGAEHAYATSPQQVYDLLVAQAGMRVFDIDGNGPYSRDQFVEVYHQPIWNFVAHR
jgi:FkbM family methyltransferase